VQTDAFNEKISAKLAETESMFKASVECLDITVQADLSKTLEAKAKLITLWEALKPIDPANNPNLALVSELERTLSQLNQDSLADKESKDLIQQTAHETKEGAENFTAAFTSILKDFIKLYASDNDEEQQNIRAQIVEKIYLLK